MSIDSDSDKRAFVYNEMSLVFLQSPGKNNISKFLDQLYIACVGLLFLYQTELAVGDTRWWRIYIHGNVNARALYSPIFRQKATDARNCM